MNKVLGKLRMPYDLKKRFDHREDMVSLEQVGNFELLINELLEHEVPGEFVELGCYTGSTAAVFAALLAAHRNERRLHVYDSFDIELGSVKGIREVFEESADHRRADVAEPGRRARHGEPSAALPLLARYLDVDEDPACTAMPAEVRRRLLPALRAAAAEAGSYLRAQLSRC